MTFSADQIQLTRVALEVTIRNLEQLIMMLRVKLGQVDLQRSTGTLEAFNINTNLMTALSDHRAHVRVWEYLTDETWGERDATG